MGQIPPFANVDAITESTSTVVSMLDVYVCTGQALILMCIKSDLNLHTSHKYLQIILDNIRQINSWRKTVMFFHKMDQGPISVGSLSFVEKHAITKSHVFSTTQFLQKFT